MSEYEFSLTSIFPYKTESTMKLNLLIINKSDESFAIYLQNEEGRILHFVHQKIQHNNYYNF